MEVLFLTYHEPQDRPATVSDMLRLGDSIRMGQREMAQMIIDGLRPRSGHSFGPGPQDPGNDGDVEEVYSRPRARKSGGPKRRSKWENELSVCLGVLSLGLAYTNPATSPRAHAEAHHSSQLDEEHSH